MRSSSLLVRIAKPRSARRRRGLMSSTAKNYPRSARNYRWFKTLHALVSDIVQLWTDSPSSSYVIDYYVLSRSYSILIGIFRSRSFNNKLLYSYTVSPSFYTLLHALDSSIPIIRGFVLVGMHNCSMIIHSMLRAYPVENPLRVSSIPIAFLGHLWRTSVIYTIELPFFD